MAFIGREGYLKFLRVTDNVGWGHGADRILTEVVVVLYNFPNEAYGLDIKPDDPNLPVRMAMLSALRDAYVHRIRVNLQVDLDTDAGRRNGMLRRVNFLSPPTPPAPPGP